MWRPYHHAQWKHGNFQKRFLIMVATDEKLDLENLNNNVFDVSVVLTFDIEYTGACLRTIWFGMKNTWKIE